MTSCTDIQDVLSAYLDRELPDPERAGIDAHLKRCAGCRALLEELAAVDRFLHAEAMPASGADLKAKLRAQLGLEGPASARPAPMPPPLRYATHVAHAALLVAAGAVIAVAIWPEQVSRTRTAPPSAPARIAVAPRAAPIAPSTAPARLAASGPARTSPPSPARTSPPSAAPAEPAAHARLRAELAAIARDLDAMDRDVKAFRTDAVRAAGSGHQRVISRRFEEWK